ncbi:MAG: mechanosensitive ion channel family protein [Geminicoccaceae bacterium]
MVDGKATLVGPTQAVLDRLMAMGQALVGALPQIIAAVIVLVLTWFLAKLAGRFILWTIRGSRLRPSLIELSQNLASILVWLVGILVAATIAFPEMSPTDLLAALGIGSVAIGFAFKDIFENFLAGILVLYSEPMRLRDYVYCNEIEGTVEKITVRDTHLRQVDGQLVVLPNAYLFKNPVIIRTDQETRRVTITAGVAYGEDVARSREVIERAVQAQETVAKDQPVQVFAQAFGSSSIDFEVAWWTGSRPVDIRRSRDEVIEAIKSALDAEGIEIPFPYRTLTFKEPLHLARGDKGSEPSG